MHNCCNTLALVNISIIEIDDRLENCKLYSFPQIPLQNSTKWTDSGIKLQACLEF